MKRSPFKIKIESNYKRKMTFNRVFELFVEKKKENMG